MTDPRVCPNPLIGSMVSGSLHTSKCSLSFLRKSLSRPDFLLAALPEILSALYSGQITLCCPSDVNQNSSISLAAARSMLNRTPRSRENLSVESERSVLSAGLSHLLPGAACSPICIFNYSTPKPLRMLLFPLIMARKSLHRGVSRMIHGALFPRLEQTGYTSVHMHSS